MSEVSLITGGASGLGRALAEALSGRGDHVVIADLDGDAAASVAEELPGEAEGVQLDVRDADHFAEVIDAIEGDTGPVTTLVNNAGVSGVGPSHELPRERWELVLDVNLRGVLHGVLAVYPRMVGRGAGRIVNIASLSAFTPTPFAVAYSTSKHAVVGLSRSLRAEAASHGVEVNVVCPGFIDTPLLHEEVEGGAGLSFAKLAKQLKMPVTTTERVVRDVMRGIDRNTGVIVTPNDARVTRLLASTSLGLGDRVSQLLARRINRR